LLLRAVCRTTGGQHMLLGPDGPSCCPGFVFASRLRNTNSPPGSLRAGLFLDGAVSGNRQISFWRAPYIRSRLKSVAAMMSRVVFPALPRKLDRRRLC